MKVWAGQGSRGIAITAKEKAANGEPTAANNGSQGHDAATTQPQSTQRQEKEKMLGVKKGHLRLAGEDDGVDDGGHGRAELADALFGGLEDPRAGHHGRRRRLGRRLGRRHRRRCRHGGQRGGVGTEAGGEEIGVLKSPPARGQLCRRRRPLVAGARRVGERQRQRLFFSPTPPAGRSAAQDGEGTTPERRYSPRACRGRQPPRARHRPAHALSTPAGRPRVRQADPAAASPHPSVSQSSGKK